MSNYLVVQAENQTKSYKYKTTHTGNPYIQVNKTGYLDLTTKTTTGIQLKYRQEQKSTKTITYNQQSTGVSITGYSGQAVFEQTTGYRGVSTEQHVTTNSIATKYSGYSSIGSSYTRYNGEVVNAEYTSLTTTSTSTLYSTKKSISTRNNTNPNNQMYATRLETLSITNITVPYQYSTTKQTNIASALATSTAVGNLLSTTALISTSIGNTTSSAINNSISVPLTKTITYINNITETVSSNVFVTSSKNSTTSNSGTITLSKDISTISTISKKTITTGYSGYSVENKTTTSTLSYYARIIAYTGVKSIFEEKLFTNTSNSSFSSRTYNINVTYTHTKSTINSETATGVVYLDDLYTYMMSKKYTEQATKITTITQLTSQYNSNVMTLTSNAQYNSYFTKTTNKTSLSMTSSQSGNLSNEIPLTITRLITTYTTTSINNVYRPLEVVTKSSSSSTQVSVTTKYSGKSTYYRTTTYYNVNSRTTSVTYKTYSGYKGYRYNNDINPSIFYVTNNATSNAYNNSSYSVTQANSANGTTYQFRTTYMTSINNLQSSRVQTGIQTYLGNSYTQRITTSSTATSIALGNLVSTTAFTTTSSSSTSKSYTTEI